MFKKLILLFLILLAGTSGLYGQIELPRLISDGMVLQRDANVTIWGWAEPGENITIRFIENEYLAEAGEDGTWSAELRDLQPGGPYVLEIITSEIVTVNDVLVGDVWVASGQSNMELPMHRVAPLYRDELETADYPEIRFFRVPQLYDFQTVNLDLQGGNWIPVTTKTLPDRYAAAYFFAKEIHQRYDVPVGIIEAAVGGSPAEAWLSEDALRLFPDHFEEAQRFKNDAMIEWIHQRDNERISAWYRELNEQDLGYQNPDFTWRDKDIDTSGWDTMQVPGFWAKHKSEPLNGVVWFRKNVNLPTEFEGEPALLELGRIVDADSVFVNDTFVGTTSYQYPPRWYDVPEGLLKAGENTISIRVINERGNGGFVPDKPYELSFDDYSIDLAGEWHYKVGAEMDPLPNRTFIQWKPLGLFNGMIHPLVNYSIKGVIWYQGESNTANPKEYRDLFPAVIKDWRQHWSQGDFPFLFVQLANYMEPNDEPTDSNWARLREAQLQALRVPNTGMVVAIDIGEWNDIHPLNKKDVGKRLALSAKHIAYEKDIVHSGPRYRSMQVDGDKITLAFDHIGSGLKAKNGDLQEFAIAGRDQQFVWANAEIDDDKIIVWSNEVPNPVAVRYAWANNPEHANLYNKEGLPTSPFRTDNW